MPITFHGLGPLEVRSSGRPVRISGRKPRLLLATLLLDEGRVVGADQLIEVLWPATPPRSAQANVRTYVSSLRSDLGEGFLRGDGSGYAIDVPDGALDLHVFEDLAGQGRHAEALGLWRGAPLADLPGSPLWDRRIDALNEARWRCAEELAGRRMGEGDHAGAITVLRWLLGEHPYREDLWERLLLTLHRGGRKAEALRAYAGLRERFVDELGVEPGASLRVTYEGILADEDPASARWPSGDRASGMWSSGDRASAMWPYRDRASGMWSSGDRASGMWPSGDHASGMWPSGDRASGGLPFGGAVVPRPVAAPRQLPPDLPDFTGRAADLARLAVPFPVAVVSGPPGSGKSALAVHAAHALCDGFPAGQLYLELDGREPADLLAEALRALGVTAPPPMTAERSALYRSLLAEHPMLVLLDDAADAAQVRPLLPGNGSVVIVTSRRRITELPGALRIGLGELPAQDALLLLGRIAGAERVAREPEDALAIVEACGRLPLAVRSAGARLAGRPGWALSVLRQRLDDDGLGELKEVRVSLDRSYRDLPEEAVRTLGTFGLLGPGAQPGWVVAAALGRDRADDVTDLLVDANLLEPAGTDPVGQPRYRVPGLIRLDALERGQERAALARVLEGWTAATERAMARLPTTVFSLTAPSTPRWSLPEPALERLTTDALGWFEAEHDALVGAVEVAAGSGPAGAAWGLAAAMVPYLDLRCHLDTWSRTHQVALESARAGGDTYGEAAMLRGLAQVALYRDRYEESAEGFIRSRRLFHELGDTRAEATSICGLGAVSQFRGRHEQSLGHFKRALVMFEFAGDQQGEAFARQAIGRVCLKSGDHAQASESLTRAMRLARELGDTHREGCVCLQLGQLHQTMSFHRHALDIFESLGDRHCGAYALQSLARLQAAHGELAPASAGLERSLEIFVELGDRSGTASVTQLLGELNQSLGRPGLALGYLERASALRRSLAV